LIKGSYLHNERRNNGLTKVWFAHSPISAEISTGVGLSHSVWFSSPRHNAALGHRSQPSTRFALGLFSTLDVLREKKKRKKLHFIFLFKKKKKMKKNHFLKNKLCCFIKSQKLGCKFLRKRT